MLAIFHLPTSSAKWHRWNLVVLEALLCFALGIDAARAAESEMAVEHADEVINVTQGGQRRLQYRSVPHPNKPYLQSWRSPAGVELLLDDSAGHSHHHGLMFALGVDRTNFWHEDDRRSVIGASVQPESTGKQLSRPAANLSADSANGREWPTIVDQTLDWGSTGKPPLVTERRRVYLQSGIGSESVSMLTWRTDLQPAEGRSSVSLWGAPYFGLGLRFSHEFDGRGEFHSADARPAVRVRDEEMIRYGRWCAYTVPHESRTVTILMFDHPKNSKSAVWFTMSKPFAFLSASLAIDRESYELKAGDSLRLCYGLAVADRNLSDNDIEKLYDRWLKGRFNE
jgi:hypothetical protein